MDVKQFAEAVNSFMTTNFIGQTLSVSMAASVITFQIYCWSIGFRDLRCLLINVESWVENPPTLSELGQLAKSTIAQGVRMITVQANGATRPKIETSSGSEIGRLLFEVSQKIVQAYGVGQYAQFSLPALRVEAHTDENSISWSSLKLPGHFYLNKDGEVRVDARFPFLPELERLTEVLEQLAEKLHDDQPEATERLRERLTRLNGGLS